MAKCSKYIIVTANIFQINSTKNAIFSMLYFGVMNIMDWISFWKILISLKEIILWTFKHFFAAHWAFRTPRSDEVCEMASSCAEWTLNREFFLVEVVLRAMPQRRMEHSQINRDRKQGRMKKKRKQKWGEGESTKIVREKAREIAAERRWLGMPHPAENAPNTHKICLACTYATKMINES